jgi:hypothetical protein
MRCHVRPAVVWIGVLFAVVLMLPFAASPAWACLGGYCGPDWQVGNSPLILIGTIEKVAPGRIVGAYKYRDPFESGGGESHETAPTIASVRITRILKGKYADRHIRIGGGPINNCCDADWFYTFKSGEQKVFILPYFPVGREVELEWSGSMRELTDTSMIETRVARAKAFRDAYLADLRREQPKLYAAGMRLAEQLRKDAKAWPEEKYDKQGKEDFAKALKELQGRLATVEVEAIRAALALEWLADDSGYWWRKSLWCEAVSNMEASRAKEIGTAEYLWIRKTLASAGIEQEHIGKYLAAVQKGNRRGLLCFPPQAPTDWSFFHRDYEGGEEILSTDFILRYHSYDRGAMLHAYAGTLDSSVLANVDGKRVKPWVISLLNNDDERLRWVAERIVAQAKWFKEHPLPPKEEN